MAGRSRPSTVGGLIELNEGQHPWSGLFGQLVIVALLLASAAWVLYPLRERAVQNQRLQSARERVSYEELRAKRLRYEIKQLRENPGYIEQVARGSLGMVRQGEVAYVVLDQRVAKPKPAAKADKGLLEILVAALDDRF